MDESVMRQEPIGNGFSVFVSDEHPFGTDAVLLANFSSPKKSDRAVDLGTGCGIIPLLMARDGVPENIVGVEIDERAAALARRGAGQCPDRFSVCHADLCDLAGKLPFGAYTLVTCNPPYKAAGAGLQNPNSARRTARHEVACTLRDVVQTAAKLLQSGGRFCACLRPERLSELLGLCHESALEPKRLRLVCTRVGEEPWLFLLECKRDAKVGLRVMPTLYTEENGKLSDEMIAIYGSYKEAYLK